MPLAVGMPGIPCIIASGGGAGGISPPAGQIGGSAVSPTVIGITETGGPTALTIGAITDGQFLKRVGATLVGAAAGGGGGLGFETFRAETLDPADATWTNTVTADLGSSVATASVQVLTYSGSTLQARGEIAMPPAGTATVTIEIISQAAVAPGVTNNKVQWRIASRSLDAGSNTNYDLAVATNANNTTFATYTVSGVTLASLGWTAGVGNQFQLVRVISGVTNNMTQVSNVKLIRFTYA